MTGFGSTNGHAALRLERLDALRLGFGVGLFHPLFGLERQRLATRFQLFTALATDDGFFQLLKRTRPDRISLKR